MAAEQSFDCVDHFVADQTLRLDPRRALLWLEANTLLIADLHLGKAQHFRRHGLAIPDGDTQADLARLSTILTSHQPQRLVILGDVVHHDTNIAPWLSEWQQWREDHAELEICAVMGNHDRHAQWLRLGISAHREPWLQKPFALMHEPHVNQAYGLCGHLHPMVTLRDGRHRLYCPAFAFTATLGCLPAFAAFSGRGALPYGHQGVRKVFACAGDAVIAMPT